MSQHVRAWLSLKDAWVAQKLLLPQEAQTASVKRPEFEHHHLPTTLRERRPRSGNAQGVVAARQAAGTTVRYAAGPLRDLVGTALEIGARRRFSKSAKPCGLD